MLALGSTAGRTSAEATEEVAQIGGPRLTITLFVTGLLGITFEILVVRLAAQVMQDTIYTFAGLLAAYLLGTAAGGLAWQRAGRRVQDASLGGLLAGTALACLTTAFLTPYIARIAEIAVEGGLAGELAVAMALFLVPSAAMGAVFGLLAQRTRDQRGSLGWAVGINRVGASVGPMVTASVVDDAFGARYLEVNGRFRMGGTSSARSDYRQAMLPLLLHPAPHRALFLGIGTGATLVGGSQMPGVNVHGVELSREVVELLPWFADPGAPAAAPRVTVADARRFIAADTTQYDVIIADLFHPALDGSGALYTTDHFETVRRRLAQGGVFCQWLPLYQLDLPSLRAIIRGFLEIYPGASAWLNHYSVRTPMLALIGPRDGGTLDLDALDTRLRDP